jgi:hypothetical protein
MSRIYFHTPTETVEVYGTERAYMGQLCNHFAAGIFGILRSEEKVALVPSDHYIHDTAHQQHSGWGNQIDHEFEMFLQSCGPQHFADGEEIFATVLNTCLRVGSAPMALAARVHGQCEIHGYVEPEDGEFIAGLIEDGFKTSVFREGHGDYPSGWREACRVLRAGEIVVTSYSVCESFPNAYVAFEGKTWIPPLIGVRDPADRVEGDDPDARDWDVWYDLSDQERWDLAVDALRTGIGGLRWSEDGWRDFYFGSGQHALDYVNGVKQQTEKE